MRILISLVILTSVVDTVAQDPVYPQGLNILCEYSMTNSSITAGDTLVIQRVVVNNESYSMAGLYFSENLPSVFAVIQHTIRVNGNGIQYVYPDPDSGSVVAGFEVHRWLVDSPDAAAGFANEILSGDSVVFDLALICETPGTYEFPLHTVVAFGNGAGLFSVANPVSVVVTGNTDSIPPAPVIDLAAD